MSTDITFIKELEIQSAEGELAVISIFECYGCKWRFVGDCMRYDYGYTSDWTDTPKYCPMCGEKILNVFECEWEAIE